MSESSAKAFITDPAGSTTAADVRDAIGTIYDDLTPTWYFDRLTSSKWKTAVVENQTVSASSTHNLINLTTTSGMVKSVFLAVSGPNGATYDGLFKVTVDGESTPSITADLGSLFGVHYMVTPVNFFRTPSIYAEFLVGQGQNPNQMGTLLLLPIPFSTSITISYQNRAGTDATIWAIVTYTTDTSPSYRLKCSPDASADYTNKFTVTSGSTKTLLDLAAGNSGWLVHHGMVLLGASNNTMLERDIEIQIDREAAASYKSSGLEDWFGQSFYGIGGKGLVGPVQTAGEIDPNNREFIMGIDLMAQLGGIRFDDGVIVTLGTEAAVTTDFEGTSTLLYYLDLP